MHILWIQFFKLIKQSIKLVDTSLGRGKMCVPNELSRISVFVDKFDRFELWFDKISYANNIQKINQFYLDH